MKIVTKVVIIFFYLSAIYFSGSCGYPHNYKVISGGTIEESRIAPSNYVKNIDMSEYFTDSLKYARWKDKRFSNADFEKNYKDIINIMDSLKRPRFGRK